MQNPFPPNAFKSEEEQERFEVMAAAFILNAENCLKAGFRTKTYIQTTEVNKNGIIA